MDPEDHDEKAPQEDQENTSPVSDVVQHENIVPTRSNGWMPGKIHVAADALKNDYHAIK
jgi:hypothetical protein